MSPTKLTAIYFDLDGTLVNSEMQHAVSWQHVLSQYHISYDLDEFCNLFSGKPTRETAATLVAKHQLAIDIEQLAAQKHTVFAAVTQSQLPQLMPHAIEMLRFVQQTGLKCALVTGSAKSEAEAILNGYDLWPYFQAVVTRDDVVKPKPHPEAYLTAVALLGESPATGIAIEDTNTGLCSANGAELYSIVVPNKHSASQDLSIAKQTFTSLAAVQAYLSQNFLNS